MSTSRVHQFGDRDWLGAVRAFGSQAESSAWVLAVRAPLLAGVAGFALRAFVDRAGFARAGWGVGEFLAALAGAQRSLPAGR